MTWLCWATVGVYIFFKIACLNNNLNLKNLFLNLKYLFLRGPARKTPCPATPAPCSIAHKTEVLGKVLEERKEWTRHLAKTVLALVGREHAPADLHSILLTSSHHCHIATA